MAYVIQLVGLVAKGESSPQDGQFVVEYDPSVGVRPGECLLRTSPLSERAKRFPSRESAHDEWMRVDARRPVRPDGKPNRPLTAWTILIVRVPD